MDAVGELLLEIYRAARQLPPDEFAAAAMALLRTAVDFDSARLLCADMSSGKALVQGSIVYNIPYDNALDWESIQQQDLVLPHVLAHPGMPLAFHAPTLFAGSEHAIMRDYVHRYEHRNGLVIAQRDADSGYMDGLSLYRAHPDAYFGEREQHLVREVMAHLQEAIKLNRQLAAPDLMRPLRGSLLIAHDCGAVQYCAPQSQQLMQTEWPDWRRDRLPAALLNSLRQPSFMVYRGTQVIATCQHRSTLLFLRIALRSPLMRLSRRERQVAALYGKGLAAKAVAIELGITPATARNMLQKIYQKLDVHDKAALAQLLHQHDK